MVGMLIRKDNYIRKTQASFPYGKPNPTSEE